MLRTDGLYGIYMIQHFDRNAGKFVGSSFDYFGDACWKTGKHVRMAQNSCMCVCGDCWQRTGVHGTFRIASARWILRWLRLKHPTHEFRIVKVTVSQKTEPINA